jgi:hypothetical protein
MMNGGNGMHDGGTNRLLLARSPPICGHRGRLAKRVTIPTRHQRQPKRVPRTAMVLSIWTRCRKHAFRPMEVISGTTRK